MRISTADTPKISECSHRQTPEKKYLRYAMLMLTTPRPTLPSTFFEECWPDNWDVIVLTNADERIEKEKQEMILHA